MRIHAAHEFGPVYDEDSRILILGSFPSVKSREQGFYYGHPQNRFWKILEILYAETIPPDVEAKKNFLLRHHLALWDVIESCDIEGSSDISIRNVRVNDIRGLLFKTRIREVLINGRRAYGLYQKYIAEPEAHCLPSTSPANAAYRLDRLVTEWGRYLVYHTDSL